VLTFDSVGFAPAVALRCAVGVVAALSIGMVAESPTVGIAAAAGAFNAGTASLSKGIQNRVRTMATAGFGFAASTFLGTLTAKHIPERLIVIGLLALIFGLLTESGLAPPPVAAQSLIGFVLLGRLPLSLHDSLILAGEILLGCLGQILLLLLIPLGNRPDGLWSFTPVWTLQPAASAISRSVATLRAAPSDTRWHAARSGIAIVLAELLAIPFDVLHGYWIPLTVVVVLKSDWSTTVRQVLARWSGTLLGVIPASIALTLFHPRGALLVLLIGILAWATLTVFRANYALYCVFLSVYVVLSLDVVFVTPSSAAADRLLNTTIGAILAIAVFAVVRPVPWRRPAQAA
jgi:uncharacterized membrane protein YccC